MEPLMSQRHARWNHHPRPKPYDGLNGLILLDQSLPTKAVFHIPQHPFRLMGLPVEIRRLVYEHYFGRWEVTLVHERLTMQRTIYHVHGVPSLDLLLTCWAVYRESKDLRMSTFNGRLNLNSVFILLSLRRKARFDWLRQNVRILHFSDSSVHPERWNRYYDSFPHLCKLEIEFPNIVRLDHRCGRLHEVLEGQHDHVLLESLDTFRLALVDQLSEMVQVIVSQRYCLRDEVGTWQGVLNVEIQLSNRGTRIVTRDLDMGVSVVSKKQFQRPAEL